MKRKKLSNDGDDGLAMSHCTYVFEDNVIVKGHLYEKTLCAIGVPVFPDYKPCSFALVDCENPRGERDVLQHYIVEESPQ